MSSNLNDIQNRLVEFREARDWKQFHKPKDLALSLVLEAAELMEHFQWKNDEESLEHIKNNKEAVEDELADVLNWVLLIANDLDIDLEAVCERKLAKNNKKYAVDKSKGNHKKYN